MFRNIFIAWGLLALTVAIHSLGLAAMSHWMAAQRMRNVKFWPATRMLINVAWLVVILHMLEITLWALFFWWQDCLPSLESSIYFSAVTYATVGYGDLVLPLEWRMFGPMEGLTGILMCGLSVSFFVAVVAKLFRIDDK